MLSDCEAGPVCNTSDLPQEGTGVTEGMAAGTHWGDAVKGKPPEGHLGILTNGTVL